MFLRNLQFRTLCVFLIIAIALVGLAHAENNKNPDTLTLAFSKPANEWLEGLPLANGISAAMVWGMPSKVIFSLNHVDFWRDHLEKEIGDYSKYLRHAQQLMLQGKAKEAVEYYNTHVNKTTMIVMPRQKRPELYGQLYEGKSGREGYTNSFQPIGNLLMEFDNHSEFSNYRRTLDLRYAIAVTEYKSQNNLVSQHIFIPAREDVILIRLTAEEPISGRISFDRPPQDEYHFKATATDQTLTVNGVFDEGVKSAMIAKLKIIGGKGSVTSESDKTSLRFTDITDAIIYIALDAGKATHDYQETCQKKISEILNEDYNKILGRHRAEHSSMFDRVEFILDKPSSQKPTDTNILVERARQGKYEKLLAELVFQMGRYLIMSCNRAGRRPANLQGIWNDRPFPTWDADWHTDMNIQMNHWLVNPTNLDECNKALFRQIELVVEQTKRNAKKMAGCRGVLFYGLIGGDDCIWSPEGGFWTGSAGWLGQHFWTHYEFTLDREFLAQRAYPFIKEVGLFYKDFLVKNNDGKYVSGLSHSPESGPPNGFVNNVHCTMDTAIIREVMRHLLEAGKILNVDRDLWPVWQDLYDNILPYPISPEGILKEWPPPLQEQPAHRHFSHLYPLFPGDEFTKESTPELFTAARQAVELREANREAYASWSFPYMACFYGRFGDGNQALKNLHDLARGSTVNNLLTWYPAGYRLFQIEAGFGATAAIAEMLLQSHQGLIRLLPALPSDWSTGHYKGLKARGAFVVDVNWKDGKATQATIKSLKGTPCNILNCRDWNSLNINSMEKVKYSIDTKTNVISFDTKPGRTYTLLFDL